MHLLRVCAILILFVFVNGKWQECDGGSKIKKVTCNGKVMGDSSLCQLSKGKNASLSVDFIADETIKTLTSVCHGIISGVPIPFKDIEQNGCKGMSPSCPLQPGKPYTFTTNIFVKEVYPSPHLHCPGNGPSIATVSRGGKKLRLLIKWEEVDTKTNKDEWCLILPAQIV